MIGSGILLFVVALGAGLLAFYVPKVSGGSYKLALVFAGSYLFSITVIHILPGLYHQDLNPGVLGAITLAGFFLQQGLEFFSKGIEHGHIHVHEAGHVHRGSSAILAVAALSLHSLLEGGMLAHADAVTLGHDSGALLWGILIHKAPEAFALMSVLVCELNRRWSVVLLILFALASPLGLVLSESLLSSQTVSPRALTYLLALVSGNFLHISTTIVFESSLDHRFNAKKMGVAVLAAVVVVMGEVLF
jgi:zinc transporter ZupT